MKTGLGLGLERRVRLELGTGIYGGADYRDGDFRPVGSKCPGGKCLGSKGPIYSVGRSY